MLNFGIGLHRAGMREERGRALITRSIRQLATLTSFAALSVAFIAPAALACDQLRAGAKGVVVSVTDGDTLELDSGVNVRLVGIQAPKLALGREGLFDWPLGAEARDALGEMALGQTVQLMFGGAEKDRHGRALAHVRLQDGTWLQQQMLELGLARVYSFPDNRACLDALYASEREARANRLGMWALDDYKVRSAHQPEKLAELSGHYEVIEGRVLNADMAGSMIYLNFGRVWKEDFTLVIDREAQKLFAESGLDALGLEESVIRVRGWLEQRDGPRIGVTHPEQIEVLVRK